MIRKWIRTYFNFNRKEVNGMMVLVPLLLLVFMLPGLLESYLVRNQSNMDQPSDSLYQKIKKMAKKRPASVKKEGPSIRKFQPFSFDPNTIDEEALSRMGLSNRIVSNIIRYRNNGGQFRIKKDLSKIYGLDGKLFLKLEPFIELPDAVYKKSEYTPKAMPSEQPKVTLIDINQADTTELKQIRGVGSVLSKRIITFRDRLGGFHNIGQLSEVYGLKDSVVLKLQERFYVGDSIRITKLDLLKSSVEELRNHPYINYRLSNLIVAYRKQHKVTSLNQIRDIKIITDSIYKKIQPYLYVEDQ